MPARTRERFRHASLLPSTAAARARARRSLPPPRSRSRRPASSASSGRAKVSRADGARAGRARDGRSTDARARHQAQLTGTRGTLGRRVFESLSAHLTPGCGCRCRRCSASEGCYRTPPRARKAVSSVQYSSRCERRHSKLESRSVSTRCGQRPWQSC